MQNAAITHMNHHPFCPSVCLPASHGALPTYISICYWEGSRHKGGCNQLITSETMVKSFCSHDSEEFIKIVSYCKALLYRADEADGLQAKCSTIRGSGWFTVFASHLTRGCDWPPPKMAFNDPQIPGRRLMIGTGQTPLPLK